MDANTVNVTLEALKVQEEDFLFVIKMTDSANVNLEWLEGIHCIIPK